MKWFSVLVIGFLLTSSANSQFFGPSYQVVTDQEILTKTVKKMPEYKFINQLINDDVQMDINELKKLEPFQRVNLATAYAYECGKKKLWSEVIEVLSLVKKDIGLCVDPGNFFFTKATAEFMLGKRNETQASLDCLMEVPNLSRRYTNLAMLMTNDMATWNEKDLGYLNRRMREVADRLENGQGGKRTQKIQREILVRLDELIKEQENKKNSKCKSNENGCPDGGKPPESGSESSDSQKAMNNKIKDPASDSQLPGGIALGVADKKELAKLVQDWGNLPEKERAIAQRELERKVPEKYQSMIRNYMKTISDKSK